MISLNGHKQFYCIAFACVLAVALLTGAATTKPVGQYQMEIVVRDRSTQIYVMDTTTGAVKWVDAMDKPFEEMKGD